MRGPPRWVEKLVGIPHQYGGLGPRYDCWGLLIPCHREFGIELDELSVGAWMFDEPWPEVKRTPALGDVVYLRALEMWRAVFVTTLELRVHIGFMLGPTSFLHIEGERRSCIERIDSLRWRDRILGFYRHPEMPDHR